MALRKTFSIIGILFIVAVLSACSGEDTISRRYPCRFRYDTSLHRTGLIIDAMNNYLDFVKVQVTVYRRGTNADLHQVIATNRNGKTETTTLSTDWENYAYTPYVALGAAGTQGAIFIGRTNFNGYRAYDAQCPNCTEQYNNLYKYTLTWTENGQELYCSNCKRTYSLETGAVTSNGKGKDDHMLMTYIVTYNGLGSQLIAGN